MGEGIRLRHDIPDDTVTFEVWDFALGLGLWLRLGFLGYSWY